MTGKLHTILSIVDASTTAKTKMVLFNEECIALVVFTIPLNTLSKAHLMTISAFDIACWVSAGNLLKSFDDMVLYMYFSCPRYEVRKKESVDLEIRGVFPWCFKKNTARRNNHVKKSDLFGNPGCFFFKTPQIQENTPFLSQ